MIVVRLAQIGSRPPGETGANRDHNLDAARRLFEQGTEVVLPELAVLWYGTDPARIAPSH